MTQSGPVLAYHRTAPAWAPDAGERRAVESLLAAHDLVLAASPRSADQPPALRVVDRRTGEPPARIPEAVGRQLAAWVAARGAAAVA
jgi:hypothetical protein